MSGSGGGKPGDGGRLRSRLVGTEDESAKVIKDLKEDTAYLENRIERLEETIELKDIENDRLINDISELNDYILDLEAALAEVSLMTRTPTEH